MTPEPGSTYVLRPYAPQDLPGVTAVDAAAIERQRIDATFFVHAGRAFANTFYVAVDTSGIIAAYLLAVQDQSDPRRGWILRVATHPAHRRRGLARQLIVSGERALNAMGATEVSFATPQPDYRVQRLYDDLGYTTFGSHTPEHGDTADWVTMRKTLPPPDSLPGAESAGRAHYNPDLILGEAQSSIDFVNVLFAVSLAILAITVRDLASRPAVAILLCMIVISSFYASVFYAIVAGNVARLARLSDVNRAIRYGNVLSEYFGVYLLVVVFPLVVDTVARSRALSGLALIVDLFGFTLYIASSFDLMSRAITSGLSRAVFHIIYIALTVALVLATSYDYDILANTLAGLILTMLALVALIHFRQGETGTQEPGPSWEHSS